MRGLHRVWVSLAKCSIHRERRCIRLTTPSSATAEGGALAAGEGGGMVGSSQRDARSSSLQRMVRRLHWVQDRRPKRVPGVTLGLVMDARA